jgi:hypothetical protein
MMKKEDYSQDLGVEGRRKSEDAHVWLRTESGGG